MCVCVCVFRGVGVGGGAGVTGSLVPTMTDVRSNKWVTPGAASKAVDGRRFECRGVDDNSCQSCRWRALWALPRPPPHNLPQPASLPTPPAAAGLLFLPVRSRHFKVTSVFYSLLWCKWEMSDVLWFALSLPVHCPPSRSHSAKVYQHYKSNVLFSKHWERECWDVDIISYDSGLLSKSAGFILHIHSGRGALKIQGALRLLDDDAFVSNGTEWWRHRGHQKIIKAVVRK